MPGELGARAALQLAREADVVVVLVGEDDQLEVLDRDAERAEPSSSRASVSSISGPGVDQRQRLAAQQARIDVADLERRRQRDAVDVVGEHGDGSLRLLR